ncbi:MAG TPA: pilus assembly protein TadG-related protein [Stellaceae bacterium]|nr:pilus assembly protein TadG-related protein [Stellaceae bacterium]
MLRVAEVDRSSPLLLTLCRRLAADRGGASAVIVGLAITVLLGLAGLGTEGASWYVSKRTMQGAADAAAYGAALAGTVNYVTEAKAIAASHGFVDQTAGVSVAVNNPPLSGNYTNNSSAVEVVIQQPQARLLSNFYLANDPTIATRAVVLRGVGPDCVLALNGTASADAFVNGTTDVNLIKCGLAVNSNSASALDIVGSAQINADSASVVGGISGNGTLTTVNGTFTGAAAVPDPYANVQIPDYQSLPCTALPVNGQTIDASQVAGGIVRFCASLSLTGHETITLENGIFILDGGSLSVNNSTLNLINATIVLTSSNGSNYGTVSIHGGATINATAPTTGPMAGIAFYQDRNAPAGTNNDFSGGTPRTSRAQSIFPAKSSISPAAPKPARAAFRLLPARSISKEMRTSKATAPARASRRSRRHRSRSNSANSRPARETAGAARRGRRATTLELCTKKMYSR